MVTALPERLKSELIKIVSLFMLIKRHAIENLCL